MYQHSNLLKRPQIQTRRQTLLFLNLCWNEEIWTLWSSCGSWWERVSWFLYSGLAPVYLSISNWNVILVLCHHRCYVLPGHRRLPEIGHWHVEIRRCETLGIKRCSGIQFFHFSTTVGPSKCVIWSRLLQIHRDSSSSLSKLIMQSYHQQIDHVSLTGVTPVNMLLEMGLDKMRKDYINYLIGNLTLGMPV